VHEHDFTSCKTKCANLALLIRKCLTRCVQWYETKDSQHYMLFLFLRVQRIVSSITQRGIWCFSTKFAALKKEWLAQSNDFVSKLSDISAKFAALKKEWLAQSNDFVSKLSDISALCWYSKKQVSLSLYQKKLVLAILYLKKTQALPCPLKNFQVLWENYTT
jgi:hypothetical protein